MVFSQLYLRLSMFMFFYHLMVETGHSESFADCSGFFLD